MAEKEDQHSQADEKETPRPNDEPDVAENESRFEAPPKELTEEEELKQQVAQLEDKLLRTAAEFDNYKKRMARRYDEMIRSSTDDVLLELLGVIDNFERALEHSNGKTDFEGLRKGMEMIYNQLLSLLTKYNVTSIKAVGQPFDPGLHDAMMQVDSDEYPDGIVATEMSKGYRSGDRVLRHSKVGVSTGKAASESKSEES
jgi:molecular chaperone GrpE